MKRYLELSEFVQLCKNVGLYGCTEAELEQYEYEKLMFPAARIVMPEKYAVGFWEYHTSSADQFMVEDEFASFHHLNWAIRYQYPMPTKKEKGDLRHPIDQVSGKIEGLVKPIEEEFIAWNNYKINFHSKRGDFTFPTAAHFYHDWQGYELYQIRRFYKRMYQDNAPIISPSNLMTGNLHDLALFFDAVSYFQHLYQAHEDKILVPIQPNEDGFGIPSQVQQDELARAGKRYALSVLQNFGLNENLAFAHLKGVINLYKNYELAERIKLRNALKDDLWQMIEFMQFAFDTTSEEIAERESYLWEIFPNRRLKTQLMAKRILSKFATEYNKFSPTFAISDDQIELFLNYVEHTELALFEYILVGLNNTHFTRHSWQSAEAFLHLKSLASFPESLMRNLLSKKERKEASASGMGDLIQRLFDTKSTSRIWQGYTSIQKQCRSADTVSEFTQNSAYLTQVSTDSEYVFLGVSLSLATLLRNFTSHFLIENPSLLRGQYVRCIKAIVTTTFLVWIVSRNRKWV